ncbi:MAG: aliphatic sulfonate ABC transporter substrate-binding protein [Dehalococcoidia bacterium]|nr:aliphatic sulfonate ABC transporter substrate-binding protein [Dehalococcoidia bacterium]
MVLILTALAALLMACSAAGPGGSTSNNSPAPAGKPIKLGFSAWPGWFPWQVAQEAGIFKQAGVNVELVWFEGYLDSINALSAGQLDANSQTMNDTLTSIAAGADQHIVLVNDNSTGNDQIIADKGITSVAGLKGKNVGVEVGVVDHFLLALGLQKAGLKLSDVKVVNLETGAAAAAFASGQMDAVGVFAPFTTQAIKRPGSMVLFSSKDFPGAIPDHLVVSGDLRKNRPADVQKLVNAWYMTLDYIKAHPKEAIAIMAKRGGVSEAEYKEFDAGTTIFSVDQNLTAFAPRSDITHLNFATQEVSKFLLDNKFIEKPLDANQIFDGSFVKAYAASMKR